MRRGVADALDEAAVTGEVACDKPKGDSDEDATDVDGNAE